jgi:hypothetical protein
VSAPRRATGAAGEAGQATVETIAALPALLLAGGVALQLLLTGYSLTLADGAAEAATLAVVAGREAEPAARAALPGWAREDVSVAVRGGRVTVRLRPPSPLGVVSRGLEVTSTAAVREPGP